jgi:hypothetical protein
VLTLWLTGCVTGASDGSLAVPKPIVRLTCPQLIEYAKEFQAQAREELLKLPAGSPLAKLIVDYSKQRDACRAIKAR